MSFLDALLKRDEPLNVVLKEDITKAVTMETELYRIIKRKDNAREYAAEIMPIINEIKNIGKVITLKGIADALNARGIKTSNEKMWWATSVKNVMERSL